MAAESLCEELISSLKQQLHGQRAHEVASEVGCRDLEDLQPKLSALDTVRRERAARSDIAAALLLAGDTRLHTHVAESSSIACSRRWCCLPRLTRRNTFNHGCIPQYKRVSTTLGPLKCTSAWQRPRASRMPASINGHDCSSASSADAESAAADQPSVSVSWNQIDDTRCAMMMHRDFAKHALTKSNSSAKLPQLQQRVSSPYSPTGSPRLSSPSHE